MSAPTPAASAAPAGSVPRRDRSPWAGFAIRRSGGVLMSAALLVLSTFLIVPLIPGDPAAAIAGTNASPDAVESIRARLGLDDPLYLQFVDYVSGLLTGDLGESFRSGIPVSTLIATRLPYTITLALGAVAVVIVVSIPLGMAVGIATRGGRRRGLDLTFGAVSGFLSSFPAYVAGTLLVVVFASVLRVLPAGGAESPSSFILPIVALSIGPVFAVSRVVRQETLRVLSQDYMRTARSRRLNPARLYLRHALPNLMASTLTLTGLILAALLGGAVIIESVFTFPGLGRGIVDAIIFKDYPAIRGIILVVGLLAIGINLIIDIALGFIDSRTLGGSHHVH